VAGDSVAAAVDAAVAAAAVAATVAGFSKIPSASSCNCRSGSSWRCPTTARPTLAPG
jgi:hypothetical protein